MEDRMDDLFLLTYVETHLEKLTMKKVICIFLFFIIALAFVFTTGCTRSVRPDPPLVLDSEYVSVEYDFFHGSMYGEDITVRISEGRIEYASWFNDGIKIELEEIPLSENDWETFVSDFENLLPLLSHVTEDPDRPLALDANTVHFYVSTRSGTEEIQNDYRSTDPSFQKFIQKMIDLAHKYS